MKMRRITFFLIGLLLFPMVVVHGQSVPTKFKRGVSGDSSAGGVTVGKRKTAKPQVITYTAVSKQRVWTNTDGKAILAQLLAFSAPKDPKSGPTIIIHEGKIRLLLDKAQKPMDYPLNKLSQPDQLFAKSIAQAASKRPPTKTKPPVELEKVKE